VPVAQLPALLRSLADQFPSFAPQLIARADRACDGVWMILGYPPAKLGRLPDWQRDFVSNQRWDPDQLSRRQPIVRRGGSDVGSDIKIPWEISRLQHLPSIALAFQLTADRRYLDLVCEQLADWIARNPPGLGVNWTCAMDVALRAVSMSWAWELCRSDPRVPAELRAKLYWSLFAHGHFLRGHLEDGGSFVGNHYVANLLGLIWLGHLYPALKGATRWRAVGIKRLISHLPAQLHSDGGDQEASIAYHRLVAEMVGLAATLTRAPELVAAFVRMARFTHGVLKPDGTAPQLGDNDGGRAFRLIDRAPLDHSYLVSWAAAFNSSLSAPPDPESALLSPPPRNAGEVDPLPNAQRGGGLGRGVHEFPDSQLTALRRDDFYVLLSATPVGQHGQGGHGHNDKLSLELFLGGDVIVDPGSFSYTGDPAARNAFRSTAAHATLQVDQLEQNLISLDLFHLPERARARILRSEPQNHAWIWEAEHHGFAPLVHRRTARIDLAARSVQLSDEVTGRTTQAEHTVTARFPLAPDVSARLDGNGFLIGRGGEAILRLIAPPAAHLAIDQGWYSADYGARQGCQVLRVSLRGPLPLRLEIDLIASEQMTAPP